MTAILVASPVFSLDARADVVPATCLGQVATIVWTPGNNTVHDTLHGDAGRDSPDGGGNDKLYGQ
jgi:hypothetical protein